MTELEKIFGEIQERLGLEVSFYRENARAHGGPVCEKPFDGITDDGNYTFSRKRSTFDAFCSENVPPRACINI